MKFVKLFFLIIISGSLYFVSCRTMTIISSNDKLNIPVSTVVFTFDDGPNQHGQTTERLLDVLGKYQVKGVFCIFRGKCN